ncbi:hypothetical protein GIB67_017057 [Kingdonia uniflora]|uniref:Uncharacterized protein n=1 Tax=Kingdonia uniflora TaxID=39325 RepID=A0A7J7NCS2_9MAGN|nr:hypothetical protein GIB67_017057 [Kingdonia uniflora]
MKCGKDASVLESRTVRARDNKCQPHERERINSSSSSPNNRFITKNIENTQRKRQKIKGINQELSEDDKRLKRVRGLGSRRWEYSSVVRGKLDSTADSHSDIEVIRTSEKTAYSSSSAMPTAVMPAAGNITSMTKVSQRFLGSNTKVKQERLDQLAAVNQTGGKRGRIAELDNQRGKKQKIDHIMMQKCMGILKNFKVDQQMIIQKRPIQADSCSSRKTSTSRETSQPKVDHQPMLLLGERLKRARPMSISSVQKQKLRMDSAKSSTVHKLPSNGTKSVQGPFSFSSAACWNASRTGATSTLDEKQSGPTSRTFSAAACEEGLATISYDGQLSPEKALRVAKLKSRFADTIRKAQQRTLLSNGQNSDSVSIQKEEERLEKEQCEERARLEAQIRSIQAARMREEAELKMKREREREAARVTLQKIEKTVQFEDNLEISKELETLAGCKCLICFSSPVGGAQDMFGGSFCSPLERLGLIIKDDYIEEEEGDVFPKASYNEDLEEGEICS